MSIPSFILIGCCVSELHGHLCPYRNVWPEAVYCSFTNCLHVSIIRVIGFYHFTKFCLSTPSRFYDTVLPEAVYCCFTRTTLFTKLFTCLYDPS